MNNNSNKKLDTVLDILLGLSVTTTIITVALIFMIIFSSCVTPKEETWSPTKCGTSDIWLPTPESEVWNQKPTPPNGEGIEDKGYILKDGAWVMEEN